MNINDLKCARSLPTEAFKYYFEIKDITGKIYRDASVLLYL